jgi:hypothetical protein
MNDETAELIPFHAINEFMRDDYRLQVVKTALRSLSDVPEDIRSPVNWLIRKNVTVPGFRHSEKAPAHKKAGPTAKSFEKNPEMTAAILAVWAEANIDLFQKVFEMLNERGWALLPIEADRRKLPGFFITWPKSEDFETLVKAFSEKYPDNPASSDDINLMAVWTGMRLPYQMLDEEPSVVTNLHFDEDEEKMNDQKDD